MKVVFTIPAREDLEEIHRFIISHYPTLGARVEKNIQQTVRRIREWPESAQQVSKRPDVRMIPLVQYPYKIFYRIGSKKIEILHVHHSSQDTW